MKQNNLIETMKQEIINHIAEVIVNNLSQEICYELILLLDDNIGKDIALEIRRILLKKKN